MTCLSDSDEKLRKLKFYLNPNAEYLLDWFHITMRLTVMNPTAKGLNKKNTELDTDILKERERIKRNLHLDGFKDFGIVKV